MRFFKLLVVVCMLGISIASSQTRCFAEEDQPGRFAKRNELIGIWRRIPLPEETAKKFVERWPAPDQWFAFYEDGRVASMMVSGGIDRPLSKKDLEEVLQKVEGSKFVYGDPGGVEITYHDIPKFKELWGVNIFTRAHQSARLGNIQFQPGDIMMTLDATTYDASKSGIIYIRHLRKVE